MTLYKKSTKVFLILLHFTCINVHIDWSNKYKHQDFTEIYSVTMTLHKKSTKLYLNLLHFIFINVHTDGSNKYGWIE